MSEKFPIINFIIATFTLWEQIWYKKLNEEKNIETCPTI